MSDSTASIYVAVCWSCGWTKTARSLDAAEDHQKDHGHGTWTTDVLRQEDVEIANRVRDGDVLIDPDEYKEVLDALDTLQSNLKNSTSELHRLPTSYRQLRDNTEMPRDE